MNRKIPYDHWIILSLSVLLGMGIVVVYNASFLVYSAYPFYFIKRHMVWVALGILILYAMMKIRYLIFNRNLTILLLSAMAAGLLVVPLLTSESVKGARRWIQVTDSISFQPSEFAKIVLIILTAHFLASYHDPEKKKKKGNALVCFYLLFAALLITLVLMGRDLSTAILMTIVVLVMLYLGGLRLPLIAGIGVLGIGAFLALVFTEGYRAMRIKAFLDPEADPQGAGYHIFQSLTSFGAGGLSGEGFRSSALALDFLPEAHTDFIFAAIGHETGLVGCLIVLSFFIIFVFRGLRAGHHSDTTFGFFLGLGLASAIGLQAFLNMSVALSLCPTTGLPLPFISYGGSSTLMMLFATGILLNISGSPKEYISSKAGKRGRKDLQVGSSSPNIVVRAAGCGRTVYRQADLPWEDNS